MSRTRSGLSYPPQRTLSPRHCLIQYILRALRCPCHRWQPASERACAYALPRRAALDLMPYCPFARRSCKGRARRVCTDVADASALERNCQPGTGAGDRPCARGTHISETEGRAFSVLCLHVWVATYDAQGVSYALEVQVTCPRRTSQLRSSPYRACSPPASERQQKKAGYVILRSRAASGERPDGGAE
ncbi:hypothetical protein PYCCODRAFT_730056 [Trametes coccinea BRFM310]|uniref:Uncharacterized protein n=1 Tax=Trametes coccinea (strain BRFM310) TaxID=1353009 RepID=A0A1Y2IIH7_TRAC3|nr:hypothetical protein PYCCODRAFT_730056 [Trametes coccinea BRFM310]